MVKFNLPKPSIFQPTKSLQSKGGFGGGDTTVNNTNYYSSGLLYAYNENTTPGSGASPGAFCFNSLTAGSITKCYVSTLDQDGVDRTASLARMTSGDLNVYSPAGGVLQFSVSNMIADSGYFEFDVDHLDGVLPSVGNQYVEFVADAPGVRSCEFILNQSGTSDPVATVTKNSVGFTPSPGYAGVGKYTVEFVGFDAGASTAHVIVSNGNTATPCIIGATISGTTIDLSTWNAAGTLANDLMVNAVVTVEYVY